VGFGHTRISPVVEDGRELVMSTGRIRLTVNREGQQLTQEMVYSSVETPDRQIVRFETSIGGGGGETVVRGHVRGDTLAVSQTTQGRTETRTIPWDPAWGGFFAVEQSLEQQPMGPGEQRKITFLVPFFLQPGQVRLEAYDYERTPLLSGQRELLRINKTLSIPGSPEIVEWIWCDRGGRALKGELVGGLGGESYRTTKEVATRDLDDVAFDLFRTTTVKVERRLANPHRTRRVVYRVRMKDGNPMEVFASGPRQHMQREDEHTARLVVRGRGLRDTADSTDATDRPTREDREPNSFVQSNDEQIQRLAREAAAGEEDERRLAAALERYVGRFVQRRDFSQALATAAEVAVTRQGDCTEHAVLLAALCRARGLPARVAIGLVYSESAGGFAYHMWTEVWLREQWVPLDATLGLSGVGAAHLKICHTNLHGVSPYTAFLPVYQILGQLKIDVIEVE
jgi:transglutaminase-like putative cysteine protease